jgi:S-DNA-T family DNA segregation ATPase FtsK/SpoIIIE
VTDSLLVALVIVAFVVYGVRFLLPYLQADDDTRAAIRAAWRARRTWRRLALSLGLSYEQPPSTVERARARRAGRPEKHTTVVPKIFTDTDQFGFTVTTRPLPGVGLDEWQRQEQGLRDAWGASRLSIEQRRPDCLAIRAWHREPLAATIDSTLPDVEYGSVHAGTDIHLGYTEDGEPMLLNLRTSAHGVIAGATRSGKSITVNNLLAASALMPDVRQIIIDPNVGAVAPWWRTAHTVSSASDPEEPTDILRGVRDEMAAREGHFWRARTDKITDFSPDMPVLLVVIDEITNYTTHGDKKLREAFIAELAAVASQGAKFGVRLWLLGQKPSSAAVPTQIRANLSSRICHRVDTVDDYAHLFPDALDLTARGITAADRSMPQGVAIGSVGRITQPTRMRSAYLPSEACWEMSDRLVAGGLQLRDLPGVQAPALSIVKSA